MMERRKPLSSLSNSDAHKEGEIQTVAAPILKIIPQKIREMPSLEGSEEERDKGSSTVRVTQDSLHVQTQ